MDELLQDMAEGKVLNDAELEYVKIFANLKDMEKAQNKALSERRYGREYFLRKSLSDARREDWRSAGQSGQSDQQDKG